MSPGHDMAAALLEVSDLFKPYFETAAGMKADMERQGWSPTAAEDIAREWLRGAINFAWKTASS